jgi:L-ascorbate metabolism protein UlaG (beta-lactamase superfamily)
MGVVRQAAIVAVLVATAGCAAGSQIRPMTDATLYPEPQENAITFWGHACTYIDVEGFGIVTDPVFSRRYATIRKRLIPAPPPSSYDQTRVVLLSHAHQDHLDPATLERFPSDAMILAPEPAAKYLRKRGIHARVMKPGMEVPFPGGSITAVASHHPGGRLSLKARADGGALGYVIETPSATVYYSGDTEYFPGFSTIGYRYDPDIAIMNINAHLRFPEAAIAVADLGMPIVLPIHWGAYNGKSVRHGPKWREELSEALGPIVVPLEVGEAYALPAAERRSPPAPRPATAVPPIATSGAAGAIGATGAAALER